MNRRSFFKFLGIGAAAAPAVTKELATIPPPIPPPVVPAAPVAQVLGSSSACFTYAITMRMPPNVLTHNWGLDVPRNWGMPSLKPVRDREFYRRRHARKHGEW